MRTEYTPYLLEYPTGGVRDLFLRLGDLDLDLDFRFLLGDLDRERFDNMAGTLGGERGFNVLKFIRIKKLG